MDRVLEPLDPVQDSALWVRLCTLKLPRGLGKVLSGPSLLSCGDGCHEIPLSNPGSPHYLSPPEE